MAVLNPLNPKTQGTVPTTRKVNNKALSADISLTASDVGAVPTTRKVNNKALSSDISLTASDVGALASGGKANTAGTADKVANSLMINYSRDGLSSAYIYDDSKDLSLAIDLFTYADLGGASAGLRDHGMSVKGTLPVANGGTGNTTGDAKTVGGVPMAGKNISTGFQTAFRTQTKGNTSNGDYISVIRSDVGGLPFPQYGSGLAFGRGDTQAYLGVGFNVQSVFIGGGNENKINWTSELALMNNLLSWQDITNSCTFYKNLVNKDISYICYNPALRLLMGRLTFLDTIANGEVICRFPTSVAKLQLVKRITFPAFPEPRPAFDVAGALINETNTLAMVSEHMRDASTSANSVITYTFFSPIL